MTPEELKKLEKDVKNTKRLASELTGLDSSKALSCH